MSSWSENWIYNLIPQEEYELAFDMVNGKSISCALNQEEEIDYSKIEYVQDILELTLMDIFKSEDVNERDVVEVSQKIYLLLSALPMPVDSIEKAKYVLNIIVYSYIGEQWESGRRYLIENNINILIEEKDDWNICVFIKICNALFLLVKKENWKDLTVEDIRRVPRPVNTIVEDNGRDGPNRYSVRERSGTKYVAGHNPQPRNGKVIGHIVDGSYVPINGSVVKSDPDMLSYGGAAFVRSVSHDLLGDLLQVYSPKDAFMIMAIATLRVVKPSIAANRYHTHYTRTFVCRHYPGLTLSKNTVCTFLQKLGQDGARRQQFYQKRALAVAADHHIAIDGTLKQDTSRVNDLSAFSYKARVKGCREVSVLYAYDIEAMEPVCAEVFPGNSIDAVSYRAFIRDNDIRKGILVADKGFPSNQIKAELEERPDLHFLTPIKRNDVRIANNSMLSFDGVLEGMGEHIHYKKCSIKGGRFLYSFKSARKAAAEETAYLGRREKKGEFTPESYIKKQSLFGVIVFESDQDLEPKTAYQCYDDRWLLELVFNRYKSDECLDKTNVQGDFSVIGSEFINFISTVATCRMLRKAKMSNLLDGMSYGDLLDDLNSAWRKTDGPEQPASDDQYWVHTLPMVLEELESLGLSAPVPKPEPKKRGRPKKKTEVVKPKRPRGRPRKHPLPD